MNGVMFNTDGPIMQGNWYNPKTGDFFTVRDSFFEDNQYIVTTTDGRYMNYNQLQNYIQTDMKVEDLKRMKSEMNKPKQESIPVEVAGILENSESENTYNEYLLPEDEIMSKGLGNLNDENRNAKHLAPAYEHQVKQNTSNTTNFNSMNHACIEKALGNTELPQFDIKINWKEYPAKNIEMLKDIMDIPLEEIIDWYIGKINTTEIAENIKSSMTNHIFKNNKQEEVVKEKPKTAKQPKNIK